MRSLITIAGIVLFLIVMSFSGGDNKQTVGAEQLLALSRDNLKETGNALDAGSLKNAVILKDYAKSLAAQKPELKESAKIVAKDATTGGALYKNLEKRIDAAASGKETPQRVAELQAVTQESDPGAFNDALLDPINTLARLSDGTLPLVDVPAGERSDGAAGAAMVGNPAYGQWQSSSSGGNFWMWYGGYRMIGDLLGGGSPIGYNRWQSQRPWSYHNDYATKTYDKPVAKSNPAASNSRRASSYGGASGSRKNSAFTATPRRASTYEAARRPKTRAAPLSAPRSKRSTSRRSSNYGGFTGGFRGGSSRSRGGFSFGGK